MAEHGQQTLLARWFGDPMTEQAARGLLQTAERRWRARVRRGSECRTCQMQRLVARFWLGEPVETEFELMLRLNARTAHGHTLACLLYGQLLMSRRLNGAMEYLDRGFMEGRHLFGTGDYFRLVKRHELLRRLPLSPSAMPAEPLERLLTAARVMERLGGPHHPAPASDPNDTFG